jgi:hypothetical protein
MRDAVQISVRKTKLQTLKKKLCTRNLQGISSSSHNFIQVLKFIQILAKIHLISSILFLGKWPQKELTAAYERWAYDVDVGGLLVVKIDDLLLDAAGGSFRPPLLVLADEGDVGRASSAARC